MADSMIGYLSCFSYETLNELTTGFYFDGWTSLYALKFEPSHAKVSFSVTPQQNSILFLLLLEFSLCGAEYLAYPIGVLKKSRNHYPEYNPILKVDVFL